MIMISIITVCRNTEHEIASTIESILSQTSNNFEYLIIDGKSSDKTVDVAKYYYAEFDRKKISFKIYSEPDTGIYNAMNKGIAKCCGKWLLFLNAGDRLAMPNVIETVEKNIDSEADINYGNSIFEYEGLYRYERCLPLSKIENRMPFCHQSVFISNRVMNEFLYDETYKIAADYDFFLKCYKHNKKFHFIDFPIAYFILGGVSTNGNERFYIEHNFAQYKNGVISDSQYKSRQKYIKKCTRKAKVKNAIKKMIPQAIFIWVRKNKLKKQGFSEVNPILNLIDTF